MVGVCDRKVYQLKISRTVMIRVCKGAAGRCCPGAKPQHSAAPAGLRQRKPDCEIAWDVAEAVAVPSGFRQRKIQVLNHMIISKEDGYVGV